MRALLKATTCLKTFVLGVGFAIVLAGCSTDSRRSTLKPTAPVPGEPIDRLNIELYLKDQCARLWSEGRVATNLLSRTNHLTCSLKLTPPSTNGISPAELVEKNEMSVAVIVLYGKRGKLAGSATGFFLTESGALATCKHVVANKRVKGMAVMTRDGRVCPVRELLAVDPTNDVAIVQVEGKGFTPVPVAPAARPGSPVWVISHPLTRFYSVTAGIVSGYFVEEDGTYMDITADFAIGSSGAPVFNEYGAVVGLANFTSPIWAGGFFTAHQQMVTKGCVPSAELLKLIREE